MCSFPRFDLGETAYILPVLVDQTPAWREVYTRIADELAPAVENVHFQDQLEDGEMRFDYQLWPDTPALMHVQSLAWFAGVVVAATVFYRREH